MDILCPSQWFSKRIFTYIGRFFFKTGFRQIDERSQSNFQRIKTMPAKINKSQNSDRHSGVGIRLTSGLRMKVRSQTFVWSKSRVEIARLIVLGSPSLLMCLQPALSVFTTLHTQGQTRPRLSTHTSLRLSFIPEHWDQTTSKYRKMEGMNW